jgi:hypothetical protein
LGREAARPELQEERKKTDSVSRRAWRGPQESGMQPGSMATQDAICRKYGEHSWDTVEELGGQETSAFFGGLSTMVSRVE